MTGRKPSHRMPRRWGRGRRARIGTDAATSGGIDKDSATDTATEDRVEAGPVETDAPHREVADHKSDAGVAETSSGDEEQDADAEAEDAADMSDQDGAPARRPAGKRLVIAVGVAAALFVGSAAFAGATVQPYLADRATVATKLKIARTAADAITTLWTYTPDNMDTLADRAANYLSGDFEAQYRKFVDGIAPANKQAKVTNNTQVTGVAVESLAGPEAIAIVYTNTTSTSPLTKGIPSLKYLSYRLFMKRAHGRWLVNRMTTITSLDLTPRL
ncbi:mammalian cell entry protein [Mycobacterium xenopi]|nr:MULTISPECIES: mammalian cell entry protein [Mycobacterium]MDA3640453.1 mammalian cell entry protein [Mycobacterium xenopi]MDA3656612.1 mammalian cell entry protein [Mycobacterium xenopi]MDA3661207.1 mammalian cell entry protein [Mycobacterium xenopi]